jgi:hypothetical protein
MEPVAEEVWLESWPARHLEMEWPLEMEAGDCPLPAGPGLSSKAALGMPALPYLWPPVRMEQSIAR